jgi:hypothetical protein
LAHYILIIGYRQQLAKAIHDLGIPYSIVSERAIKTRPRGVDDIVITSFSRIDPKLGVQGLNPGLKPTHVIAGTESGVFPAAALRRIYGARRSSKTLLTRCTDKTAMKTYLQKHEIPMARFFVHHSKLTAEELVGKLGLPVVVKDRLNSGGRNVVIAKTIEELRSLLEPQRLYEEFLDAPEGSIESFVEGGEILFSSSTEYHITKFANVVPAGYPQDQIERIRSLNRKVIKALNIKWGLTHLEYYRTSRGELFGEIALRPPGGYIMELIREAYDFDPWKLLVKIELGLQIDDHLPSNPTRVCGTVLLHPGEGIVEKVSVPDITEYPTLSRVAIKARKGDRISPRYGVGEDVGHCIFSAVKYTDVIRDIERMCQSSPIQLIESDNA